MKQHKIQNQNTIMARFLIIIKKFKFKPPGAIHPCVCSLLEHTQGVDCGGVIHHQGECSFLLPLYFFCRPLLHMLGRVEFYKFCNLAMTNYLVNMYLNLAQLGGGRSPS